MHRPAPSIRAGFSLVELVIAMSVLAILAGVVAPRVGQFSENARYAKAERDIKAIMRGLEALHSDQSVYPRDVSRGIDPGLCVTTSVPAGRHAAWEGPYMEAWPSSHPWGGPYDYEYWNYPAFDKDGIAGNEVVVSIRAGNLTAAILQKLDVQLDDGNGATGSVRHNGTDWLGMYAGEGPSW